jgi:catechol 2,3-dioxygenase-like lactoylglutathione lyase family enzyme
MGQVRHMAMCTKNNRRLARFYRLIFGMEEIWNGFQNSPYAFYISDGYINLNCLQIRPGSSYNKIVDGREIMPDVGINHIGFQVRSVRDVEKKLAEIDQGTKLIASPQDGRYEEWRIVDPDGNIFEIAEGGWEAGQERRLPAMGYVGIRTKNFDRMADFYKSLLSLKEVRRFPHSSAKAVFLSDGVMSLGMIQSSPGGKPGLERIGFQVKNIQEIEERLKKSPPFLYPSESPVEILRSPSEGPYEPFFLKDPDGNILELSEKGWEA